ncbi:MAG: cation diffusion facilitator family transporter [Proteobacteria bacterium]|nr:cation diffusion facilitator family transporter [Pseudomonadota bacterium]
MQIIDHEILSETKQKAAKNSTLVSVAINIILATAQIFVGIFSASSGLVADGIHSLSDLFSDFVVLFANHHSSKEADDDHNYGHWRYETAASLFVGLSLLGLGLGMIWSAAHKIIYPTSTAIIQIQALWVALFALVSKEILFRYMLAVATKVRSSMLVANAWHARSDAASSFVVAVGIIGALMGYPVLDLIGALVVGLVIAKTGFKFSWDALHDLMDRAASAEDAKKVRQIIIAAPKILGCHDLRTRKMGDMIFVDVHIEVDGAMTVRQGHEIAAEVRSRVISQLPVLDIMIHIDPV